MTIWISWELPLLNFKRLDILCTWIGPTSDKLWPFEFLESFRCSILNFSIYDVPELDICVNIYENLNFSRFFHVQFQATWYIMCPNRSSDWKVMTVEISQEVPSFNFKRLNILCSWIGHPNENLWPFEFLESSCCSITNVSICFAPESDLWVKIMTICISRDFPLINLELLDVLRTFIGHPSEKIWPIKFLESFRCSIHNVSIYIEPKSHVRVKIYDHSNF